MEKVVKVSKDGSSIDFFQSDKIPISPKKFRSGPELEGFYRFIFENDLRKEALAIIDRIYLARKVKKVKEPATKVVITKPEPVAPKVQMKQPQPKPIIASKQAAKKEKPLAKAKAKAVKKMAVKKAIKPKAKSGKKKK